VGRTLRSFDRRLSAVAHLNCRHARQDQEGRGTAQLHSRWSSNTGSVRTHVGRRCRRHRQQSPPSRHHQALRLSPGVACNAPCRSHAPRCGQVEEQQQLAPSGSPAGRANCNRSYAALLHLATLLFKRAPKDFCRGGHSGCGVGKNLTKNNDNEEEVLCAQERTTPPTASAAHRIRESLCRCTHFAHPPLLCNALATVC
jgi:hypothetical protein